MFDDWIKLAIFWFIVAIIVMVVCIDEGPAILSFLIVPGIVAWQLFHFKRGLNEADQQRRRQDQWRDRLNRRGSRR